MSIIRLNINESKLLGSLQKPNVIKLRNNDSSEEVLKNTPLFSFEDVDIL